MREMTSSDFVNDHVSLQRHVHRADQIVFAISVSLINSHHNLNVYKRKVHPISNIYLNCKTNDA